MLDISSLWWTCTVISLSNLCLVSTFLGPHSSHFYILSSPESPGQMTFLNTEAQNRRWSNYTLHEEKGHTCHGSVLPTHSPPETSNICALERNEKAWCQLPPKTWNFYIPLKTTKIQAKKPSPTLFFFFFFFTESLATSLHKPDQSNAEMREKMTQSAPRFLVPRWCHYALAG